MNRLKIFVPLLMSSLLLLGACNPADEASSDETEQVKTVNVVTRQLQPEQFERYIRLVGTVEAENDIRISAEVGGKIERYFVEKGETVQKGNPIAKINDDQLQREKERLEAVTAQSRENYERLKKVYEGQGIGSEMEYLDAKYAFEQNKAALESVKINLDKTTVRAPFDATLEHKLVEEGEMVSPGAVMARLIGVNRLKVNAGIPARYSDVVRKGSESTVWFDFESSDTLNLPVTFVGQSIDPDARTFKAEIALPRNSRNYKVDMVANVRIKTLQIDEALVMSKEFIYEKDNRFVVYITGQNSDGDPVALERNVRLGPSYENRVVIENGLSPEDELITVGSAFLQDSMRIKVVEPAETGIASKN